MRSLLVLLLLAAPATLSAGEGVRVTLEVRGLVSTSGQVLAALYAGPDGFPQDGAKAAHRARVVPVAPVTVVTFEQVAPGTWAGFAVHDVDGDGEVAVGVILPIPKEPVGATRDAKGRFGPPKFEDASFVVGSADVVQRFSVVSL